MDTTATAPKKKSLEEFNAEIEHKSELVQLAQQQLYEARATVRKARAASGDALKKWLAEFKPMNHTALVRAVVQQDIETKERRKRGELPPVPAAVHRSQVDLNAAYSKGGQAGARSSQAFRRGAALNRGGQVKPPSDR